MCPVVETERPTAIIIIPRPAAAVVVSFLLVGLLLHGATSSTESAFILILEAFSLSLHLTLTHAFQSPNNGGRQAVGSRSGACLTLYAEEAQHVLCWLVEQHRLPFARQTVGPPKREVLWSSPEGARD